MTHRQLLAGLALLVGGALLVHFTVEPRVERLLHNTLYLAFASCAVAVPWGVALAVLLVRSDMPARRWGAVCILAGLFVPLYLQAAGWDAGLGRQGWLSLSQGSVATPVLAGWQAAIWIHGVAALPWVVLLVGLALLYVETEFEELALLETGRWGVFWWVTLRQIAPAIVVASLWVSLSTATNMTVTDLYQVRTWVEEIYLLAPQFSSGEAPLPWTGLLVLIGGLTLAAAIVIGSLTPSGATRPQREGIIYRLGRGRYLAAGCLTASVLLLLALPLVNCVINAGMSVRALDGQLVRRWDFVKLCEIVAATPWRFADEFRWTILMGVVAATVTMLIAVPVAWCACRRRWAAIAAIGLAATGLAVPGPVLGLLIVRLLNRDSNLILWLYDRTIFAPVLALVCRTTPLAVLICWYAFRSVRAEVLELAETEGLGGFGRLWHMVLPQRAGALIATWLAAAVLTMGDLSATILVTPPGVSLLAHRVFGLLHAGVDDQVAGLCLVTSALFIGLGGVIVTIWPWVTGRMMGSEYTGKGTGRG